MASNYVEWQFQLFDLRLNRPISDSTGTCQVLTASSPAKLTIYSDAQGTSATNPLTFSNGQVRFFTDVATTSADISIITANGHALFLAGVTPSTHRVNVDPDRIDQMAVVAWFATASGVVAGSGVALPQAARLVDAFLRVTTPASGATLDVGCSTTVTGFLVGCTVEVTGYRVIDEGSTTLGARGTLLNNAITATQQNFQKMYTPANATSGVNIVWQNTTAASAGTGYIYLRYHRMVGA